MQGLQFHLNSSHDLFEFEFKVCGFMEFLVLVCLSNEIIVKKGLSYCSFLKNTRQLMFL